MEADIRAIIAFFNKAKKELNRNIFFNIPFTWGSEVKIRNLNNSVPKHNGSYLIYHLFRNKPM